MNDVGTMFDQKNVPLVIIIRSNRYKKQLYDLRTMSRRRQQTMQSGEFTSANECEDMEEEEDEEEEGDDKSILEKDDEEEERKLNAMKKNDLLDWCQGSRKK